MSHLQSNVVDHMRRYFPSNKARKHRTTREESPRKEHARDTDDKRTAPTVDSSISDPLDAPQRSNRLGLIKLTPPDTQSTPGTNPFEVDIIAIHGLGGDFENTWTHERGTLWLRDLLPRSMPGVRVFSFGYPSRIFSTQYVSEIRNYAEALLNDIALLTSQDEARPIIFICHSLGGIVFKKAMIMASDIDHHKTTFSRSKGVVFFGTPHRGSNTAKLAVSISGIVNILWKFTDRSLLKELLPDSAQLVEISHAFARKSGGFSISSFYELEKLSPLDDLIVTEASATLQLPHEWTGGLFADHREICRFENQSSHNYELVIWRLKQMCQDILPPKALSVSSASTTFSLTVKQRKIASTLNSEDYAAYEAKIQKPIVGTLDWIEQDSIYSEWKNERKSKLLIITGGPGYGKTNLMTRIVSLLDESSGKRDILCHHFFDSKVKHQASHLLALRHLLIQIATKHKMSFIHLAKAADVHGDELFNRVEALWKVLSDVIRKLDEKWTISIVIDAIDECEKDEQQNFIQKVAELTRGHAHPALKFLITARPDALALQAPAFQVQCASNLDFTLLNLVEKQERINKDIEVMIDRRLEVLVQRGVCTPKTRKKLQEFLSKNADRTFLWVSIVLSDVEERSSLSFEDVEKLESSIPTKLAATYEYFSRSILVGAKTLPKDILRIVCLVKRPLKLEELNILLNLIRRIPDDPVDVSPESVQRLLGTLVKVIDSEVSLVHISLREHLNETAKDMSRYSPDNESDEFFIARACMEYLSSSTFEENAFDLDHLASGQESPDPDLSLSDEDSSEALYDLVLGGTRMFQEADQLQPEKRKVLASKHKFYDYAASNWLDHYAECEHSPHWQDRSLFLSICDLKSHKCLNWMRYRGLWGNDPERQPQDDYPKEADPLVVTSYFGLYHTMVDLLKLTQSSSWNRGEAIYWASARGYLFCLKLLLEDCSIGDSDLFRKFRCPLFASSKYGHVECFSLLTEYQMFDIDEKGPGGKTPLCIAAKEGHSSIVQLLIEHGAEINLVDEKGWSSLHLATTANHLDTIKILLQSRSISADICDHRGRSALSWAASEGSIDCLRLLTEHPDVDINCADAKGRTPLIHAVQAIQKDAIAELLTHKATDVSFQDHEGRNAISWASESSSPEILWKLLKSDPSGADQADCNGWTPLAWALNTPGYPEQIRALLKSGHVDANRTDDIGRSPVSYAAGYGYPKIVKIMVDEAQINIDSADDDGRTPLSYAAGNGCIEVVMFLLGLDTVNVRSHCRRRLTPEDWAEKGGWTDVVQYLRNVE